MKRGRIASGALVAMAALMVFSGVAFLQRSIEMVKEQKLPDIDPNASSSDIIKTAMKSVAFQDGLCIIGSLTASAVGSTSLLTLRTTANNRPPVRSCTNPPMIRAMALIPSNNMLIVYS